MKGVALQQVVTLSGLETKTGANDSGGWTLYLFSSAGGAKFQTFDDDLGTAGKNLIGQAAEVEYDVEERKYNDRQGQERTGQNNVIRSIRAATGAPPPLPGLSDPGFRPSAFTTDRPVRSHETNRSDGLGHAIAAAKELGIKVTDPTELFALADAFVPYIEGQQTVEEGVKF